MTLFDPICGGNNVHVCHNQQRCAKHGGAENCHHSNQVHPEAVMGKFPPNWSVLRISSQLNPDYYVLICATTVTTTTALT